MSLILAMITFALVMSISPGPVNIITLTSGATRGVWKTLPFVTGATIGFTALLFILGLGIVEVLEGYPEIMQFMSLCGALYILYIAAKIATAGGHLTETESRAPRFHEGAILQWLNPKAWIACLSGIAAFTTPGNLSSLLFFCTLYFFICYFGVGIWAVIGAQASRLITTEKRLRLFNIMMGTALGLVGLYLLLT